MLLSPHTFDLGAWARARGAREGSAGELVMTCPDCGKAKLSIHVDKGVWHCWICQQFAELPNGRRRAVRGAGGVVVLLALVEGISRAEASHRIRGGYFQKAVPDVPDALCLPAPQPLYNLPIPWPAGCVPYPDAPCGLLARFAARRRVHASDAHAFRLRVGTAGRLKDRLVFPVFERGELVYYQARALWEPAERPDERYVKALNPSRAEAGGAASHQVLLNLDNARRHPEVVVVEGPMDALSVGPQAVATFGKAISDRQIAKMIDAGVRAVLLLWDGPSPGEPRGAWDEMCRAAPRLARHFAVRLGALPAGDPSDATPDQLAYAMASAAPFPGQLSCA